MFATPRQTRSGPVFSLPMLAQAMPQLRAGSCSTSKYITSVSIKCAAAAEGQSECPLRMQTPLMVHQPEEGSFEEQGSFTMHLLPDHDDQLFVSVGRCVEEAAQAAVLDAPNVPDVIKDLLRTRGFSSRWQTTNANACLASCFSLLAVQMCNSELH